MNDSGSKFSNYCCRRRSYRYRRPRSRHRCCRYVCCKRITTWSAFDIDRRMIARWKTQNSLSHQRATCCCDYSALTGGLRSNLLDRILSSNLKSLESLTFDRSTVLTVREETRIFPPAFKPLCVLPPPLLLLLLLLLFLLQEAILLLVIRIWCTSKKTSRIFALLTFFCAAARAVIPRDS